MIRLLLLTFLLGTLTACCEFREPRANCLNFFATTADEEVRRELNE